MLRQDPISVLMQHWVASISEHSLIPPHFLLQHPGHGEGSSRQNHGGSAATSMVVGIHMVSSRPSLLVTHAQPVLQEAVAQAPRGSRVPIPKDSELLTSPG